MVPKKSKSKRQPAALKYKILKKARKQKKDMPQKKLRKDLGVPNLFPFKQEFLKQMDQQREMTYKQLAESAVQRQLAAASVPAQVENQAVPQEESRKFYQQFHSIVEQADVVLMVLDARDPLGTSCQEIQQQIVQQGKRLVLVLNKIDLVPAQVLQKWLAHLRHTAPTLCFKASTQKQRVNLGRGVSVDSQESVGADKLIQTLKNYCRSDKIKTSITVGVVGYPNVGKSSLINSLKRAKVCNVGSTPGVTRKDQLIRLDSNIKLIDCPGIVFAKATNENQAQVMLRNCVRTELLKDPLIAIKFILEKCSVKILQDIYKIPFFVSMEDFLVQVARARGRLSKGGIADLDNTARAVIHDWNQGRIPYYTVPPETNAGDASLISKSIRTELAPEFNLDASEDELAGIKTREMISGKMYALDSFSSVNADMDMQDLPEGCDMPAQASDTENGMDTENDEIAMVDDEDMMDEPVDTKISAIQFRAVPVKVQQKDNFQAMTQQEREINPQVGLASKKQLKNLKKKQRRQNNENMVVE